MTITEVCISWDDYRNNVSKGFSCLQENSEFVDMTLAAEGHLVKVHRNIMALASPYLKAMLHSAPCPHPVIFLNNINHIVLSYILEYVYTGEVKIPSDILNTFVEACKSLYIKGVDGITLPKVTPTNQAQPQFVSVEKSQEPEEDNFAAHITINNEDNNYDLELISRPLPSCSTVPAFNNNIEQMDTEICSSLVTDSVAVPSNDIDISNIHNFVILKPKSSSNNIELDTSNTETAVQILSDEIIVPKGTEIKSDKSVFNVNKDLTESAVNIALESNTWLVDSGQNPSNIESSGNPILDHIEISSAFDLQSKLTQSLPKVHTDSIQTVVPKRVNKRVLKKKPTDIQSYIKDVNHAENRAKIKLNALSRMRMDEVPHYTVSNRGSLQLVLSRYIYNSHHNSNSGRKIRWRCTDYRKMHCPSYIDTENEDIVAVSVNHCHPDHNMEIRKKIKTNVMFTSLTTAVHTVDSYLKENPKK